MTRPTKNEIIKALRCTATPCQGNCREDCPYRTLEPVKDELPFKPDICVDGVYYWESCDADRIALDAAEELEEK